MKTALIFADIDNTVWDWQHELPDSTREAFARLKEQGHLVFLNSGRSRGHIFDPKLVSLPMKGIVAACGTHIEADGKLLYEELLDFGFRPSLIDGLVEIALWDFIAEDFDGYVWPDGRYRSEITLHAAGGGEQTYVCNLILDSVKPEIGAVEWKTVEGRELVTVTVSDNEAIWDVYATDMSTVFAANAYVPCVPELTVTIDVTDRDPKSPLYIELIDYAGNYKVARIEK